MKKNSVLLLVALVVFSAGVATFFLGSDRGQSPALSATPSGKSGARSRADPEADAAPSVSASPEAGSAHLDRELASSASTASSDAHRVDAAPTPKVDEAKPTPKAERGSLDDLQQRYGTMSRDELRQQLDAVAAAFHQQRESMSEEEVAAMEAEIAWLKGKSGP